MSDQLKDANEQGASDAHKSGRTFSQADVDRMIADRVSREREKFSDYDDLKAKASKFDEAEEASKSELQKALDANEKLQAEVAGFQSAKLRSDVASAKGLSGAAAGYLKGSTREELEASADELTGLINPAPRKGSLPGDARFGAEPKEPSQTAEREVARDLLSK